MTTYARIKIKAEVADTLAVKKASLERVYKRNFTWTEFMQLLLKNGTVEDIGADDINELERFSSNVREVFSPRKSFNFTAEGGQ